MTPTQIFIDAQIESATASVTLSESPFYCKRQELPPIVMVSQPSNPAGGGLGGRLRPRGPAPNLDTVTTYAKHRVTRHRNKGK